MTESLFFDRSAGLTVRDIAGLVSGEAGPGADLDRQISGIASIERAGPGDLTFFDKLKLERLAQASFAGACLTTEPLVHHLPAHVSPIVARAPYRAFVDVAHKLFPDALRPSSLFAARGTAPGAIVHPTARLEAGVTIDPGAVVGPGAEIGSGTVIGPGTVVGPKVRIGRDCSIGSRVTMVHALIGDRVIIHPGVSIGQDGFGFVPGARGLQKVPQVGRVIIQDDVEIGANCTIDRGAMSDTVIGEGTKIDNLVQIAHNVTIGRHCLLASQTGVSGSVTVGDGVMIGGQAGIADHRTVGSGAAIAAQAGVMSDVPPGERWMGTPAAPGRRFLKGVALLNRLVARADRGDDVEDKHQ